MSRRWPPLPRDSETPLKRRRSHAWLAVPASLIGHAAVVFALLSAHVVPMAPEPDAITVALVPPDPPPPPPPPPLPPSPEVAAPSKTPDPAPPRAKARAILRPTPLKPPPDVEPLPASKVAALQPSVLLGEGDLIGAATAGSGSGGGGSGGGGGRCDMVRLLEAALRKNPRVQAALARAHPDAAGRAVMVWNGDWIQNSAQAGKGLAGIREAIILEVGFAPAACRADPMRGLVVISLNDTGSARLALGARAWRWSDLLFAR
jgi:hypothetical protein